MVGDPLADRELRFPYGDQEAAGYDQRAADENRHAGADAEDQKINQLRDDEKYRDIHAEKPAKVGRSDIHEYSVSQQDKAPKGDGSNLR